MAVPALRVAAFEQEIFPVLHARDAYVFPAKVHRLKHIASLERLEASTFAEGVEFGGGEVRGSVALVVAAAPVHQRSPAQALGKPAAAVAVAVVEVAQAQVVADFVADDSEPAVLACQGVGVENGAAVVVPPSVGFQPVILGPDGVLGSAHGFVFPGADEVDYVHDPVAVIVVVPEIYGIAAETQGFAHGFVGQHVLAVGVVGAVVGEAAAEGDAGEEGEFHAVSFFEAEGGNLVVEIVLSPCRKLNELCVSAFQGLVAELDRYQRHLEDCKNYGDYI